MQLEARKYRLVWGVIETNLSTLVREIDALLADGEVE